MAQINFLADHDALTGLFNRRRFNLELQLIAKTGDSFKLMSMDLNHFKIVNDSMGHATGDLLLQEFAQTLKKSIANNGIIGRMGGDEFSIIFFGSHEELDNTTELLYQNMNSMKIANNTPFKVSTSIGVACFPDDTTSLEELANFSDAAMYENKLLKTSRVNYYTGNETLIKEEKRSQYWNKIINEALKFNDFIPVFQPIFSAINGEVYSYEVLARIKRQGKLLPPTLYMNYLEKNKMIIELDRKIIDLALRSHRNKTIPPHLMINLSYHTISSEGMYEFILERCNFYNYPPNKITFEITERIEVSNISTTETFLKNLKNHNFTLALDDFGAGYSSFFYLTELPIDYLKIDKKIINGLLKNPTDHHIINSILVLASSLNIKVIAEGIDSPELLDIVTSYEIDLLQGYFLAKPQQLANLTHNT